MISRFIILDLLPSIFSSSPTLSLSLSHFLMIQDFLKFYFDSTQSHLFVVILFEEFLLAELKYVVEIHCSKCLGNPLSLNFAIYDSWTLAILRYA